MKRLPPVVCGILLFAAGCGRVQSPLPRLEVNNPVISDKFVVESCQHEGRPITGSRPVIETRRGQTTELTGRIRSGTWSASGITGFWKLPSDQVGKHEQRSRAGDHFVTLGLFVHGDRPEVDIGVVKTDFVEVRQLPKSLDVVEFRATVPALDQRGTYVIDLQAQEMSDTPRRGEKQTKPLGFPFWRAELIVK